MSDKRQPTYWTLEEEEHLRQLATNTIAYSASEIARTMGKTLGQVMGKLQRMNVPLPNAIKKPPLNREILIEGSQGVITRLVADKSRITLKHIPSIAEEQERMGYSYISQDRNSDTKS